LSWGTASVTPPFGHPVADTPSSVVSSPSATSAELVVGQRAIFALGAAYRSRLNGLYMATFFVGGAIGSGLWGWAMARGGGR